ncbi:hypothetical protein ACFY7C_09175 [Streptomyces sp. NPDC012769]|uniref:hypothetical protein n=1 Tax=Streptomyces sp. NPDC012769 TaxID=3364848 RepID=UPI0036B3DC68
MATEPDSGDAPRSRRRILLVGGTIVLAVLVVATVAWFATEDEDEAAPVRFSAEPCWGLLDESDVTPLFEPGENVEITTTDLSLTVEQHRLAVCSGLQRRGGGDFRAMVLWWSETPFRNEKAIHSWSKIAYAAPEAKPDWGAGGETWPTGTRVVVRCEAPPSPKLAESRRAEKFLSVEVTGEAERGVDAAKQQEVIADMALKLLRGVAEQAGCTNELRLPTSS